MAGSSTTRCHPRCHPAPPWALQAARGIRSRLAVLEALRLGGDAAADVAREALLAALDAVLADLGPARRDELVAALRQRGQ